MTRLTKATLLVAFSFGINKILAILRQLIIARQFGLSAELDVFNVANNVPDMLYALISGGALAMAIIPVLTEVLTREGRDAAWRVFSRIANLAFLVTAALSILVAVFAGVLVRSQIGIAPGFTITQQALVVEIMRLNLIATLIFSMAGLLIAGLQANQHFLLPALAPILYNLGQIFGAIILAPAQGYTIAGFTLPAYGMGVYGLVYGVLIGSALFFLIQVPGLIAFKFKWLPRLDLGHPDVRKILVMLGPRVASMFFYQLTFIARDNIASHLSEGAVTALTYGWMIQQVPETLLGTALGTALLPTISEQFARHELGQFVNTLKRSVRVITALSLPAAFLLAASLPPFLALAFGWDAAATQTLLWVTRAFLLGLLGHSLLELGSRAFYAQQNARIPLIAAGLNLILYIIFGILFSHWLDVVGIGLADSLAFTAQAVFLLVVFVIYFYATHQEMKANKSIFQVLFGQSDLNLTFLRALIGSLLGSIVILLLLPLLANIISPVLAGLITLFIGLVITLPFIWKELRLLLRL